VIRGGALRVGGYGAGLAATALASIFLLRHLGVEGFGRFMTVVALLGILTVVVEAGLGIAGQRAYVREDDIARRRTLLGSLLGLRLALVPAAVAAATAFAWIAGYPGVLVGGTAVACASLLFISLAGAMLVPISAQLRFGAVTAVELARNLAIAAGMLGLSLAGARLGTFFWIYPVSAACAAVLALWFTASEERVAPRFALRAWLPLLRVAAPIAIGLVVNVLYVRFLVIAASLLSTATETGLFAASFRVLEIFIGIPHLMVGAAFPILAHAGAADEERLAYALDRLAQVSLLVACGLVLGLAVGAEPIMAVLGGEEFSDAAPVLRIQSVALVGAFLTQVWVFGLISVERQAALVVVNVLALAVVVAAGGTLIPAFGARGAAVAAVIGEATLALAAVVLLVRARPALRPSGRPLLRVLPALLAGAAVGVIPGPPAAVSALLAVCVFAAVAVAAGAVPPELRDAVRRPVR
jgi:O-antigen/teichoic acid export membrane protein